MVFGRLSSDDRVLGAALGISLALHALALAVHFKPVDPSRLKAQSPPLEVVLVNARTPERPSRAQVLAQANLDRGGNVDEDRRAATPLPASPARKPGRDLADAQRRMQQLEAQQRELLAQARPAAPATAPPRTAPANTPAPEAPGHDLTELALAAMRLQAQIERRIEEYQKRPRKQFIGANAREYRFAQYEEDWRLRIERIGTINYPPEARGRHYGNLRLTVTIRADGSVESIELDRSSGVKVLDAAAFNIVRLSAPFAAFPPEIRRDTDLLVITRTWFFGQGDRLWTEARH